MSPACPFITEHLYQNLKRIRAPHALDGSIHYQMLPEVNDQLINVEIEEAVANMTNVIRLGRTIRDQKVFFEFLSFFKSLFRICPKSTPYPKLSSFDPSKLHSSKFAFWSIISRNN